MGFLGVGMDIALGWDAPIPAVSFSGVQNSYTEYQNRKQRLNKVKKAQ
jgi:hypothetical protein